MLRVGVGEVGMKRWQAALRLIGVGWYVGISIVLGILGGWWLDNKFDTKPVFVIIGLMLGLIVAGYGVYRMLQPLIKDKESEEDN